MKDRIIAAIGLLFGTYVFILAGRFAREGSIVDNPALYPRILAGLVIGLSVILFLQSLRSKAGTGEKAFDITKQGALNILVGIGLLFLYVTAMPHVGFIISTAVFSFVSLIYFNASLKQAAIAFLPITLSIYFTFSNLLNVPLPTGPWF